MRRAASLVLARCRRGRRAGPSRQREVLLYGAGQEGVAGGQIRVNLVA